jgi:ribosome-binding factor A
VRIRPERIAHLMRREVADILQRKMRDPRVSAMVSVTDVELTQDLSLARVYVGVLADAAERDRVLDALRNAAGFVRHELGSRLDLREIPELRFEIDHSIERGARVDELLRRIREGTPIEDEEAP